MITLKKDANQMVKKLCHEDSIRAYYFSVCEQYAEDHIQVFITSMQTLITKLGIIMSTVSTSKVSISYCKQAIDYLCHKVVKSPSIEKTFHSLGLNDKGNKGKHTIINNKIDMDKAVVTFNSLVNLIASSYNLFALKDMIICKRSRNQQVEYRPAPTQAPVSTSSSNNVSKKKQKPKKDKATTKDERLSLKAELVNGDGRYQKGLFHKKKMLNFVLKVEIDNPDHLKIVEVIATFKCGSNVLKKRIVNKETEIDLETSKFSGNIVASVTATYKIGLLKRKVIKTTVSKNF